MKALHFHKKLALVDRPVPVPSRDVVNEITLLGSRCGQFRHAIDFISRENPDFSYLISRRYPLSQGITAFDAAQNKDVFKVIIDAA